jgi:hypothetical protein
MDKGTNDTPTQLCSVTPTLLEKHPDAPTDDQRPATKGPGLGFLHRVTFLMLVNMVYWFIGLGGWYTYQHGDLHLTLLQNFATGCVAGICSWKSFEYYCSQNGTTPWSD